MNTFTNITTDTIEEELSSLVFIEDLPVLWEIAGAVASTFNLLVFVVSFIVVVPIIFTKETRSRGYNLFIAFLIIPDGTYNGAQFIFKIYQVMNDGIIPLPVVMIRYFTYFAYGFVNFYLNAIITYDMFQSVRKAHKRIKVLPPSQCNVIIKCCLVYFFGALYAFWFILEVPWSLAHFADIDRGIVKLGPPPQYAEEGKYTMCKKVATQITGAVLLIPTMYMAIVMFIIWIRNLLPTSGRTKDMYWYFMRILLAFFLLYIPGVMFTMVAGNTTNPVTAHWLVFAQNIFVMLQSVATLFLVMSKADVYESMKNFYSCCYCVEMTRDTNENLFLGIYTNTVMQGPVPARKMIWSDWEEPDLYEDSKNKVVDNQVSVQVT